MRSLIEEYRAKAEADQKALHEKVAAKNAQISAESAFILCTAAHSKKLHQEHEHISPSVASAEAEV